MMKKWLLWIFLLAILGYISADTKILREVKISSKESNRQESFSLKNENTSQEELVVEGTHTLIIFPKDEKDYVYRIDTIYVADKGGYRVKYKLVRELHVETVLQLNPSTLKSVVG